MSAASEYQPRYKWRLTWPGEREDDFAGYDGEAYIGRIFLEIGPPKKGQWKWNGSIPVAGRGIAVIAE